MDFEEVGSFGKGKEVSLATKGDINLKKRYGDLPLEIKHVLGNIIVSHSVVVTMCTICCNINKILRNIYVFYNIVTGNRVCFL
jgi:hypothetical protein